MSSQLELALPGMHHFTHALQGVLSALSREVHSATFSSSQSVQEEEQKTYRHDVQSTQYLLVARDARTALRTVNRVELVCTSESSHAASITTVELKDAGLAWHGDRVPCCAPPSLITLEKWLPSEFPLQIWFAVYSIG
jgi:hypothetical protein